ncbi:MAG: hypothetical protein E6H07_07290 [Bacteroidetes bacterium]|nr:MAG: hypothetical protein E6H07_07290 [Bacteroidota bacterium]
MKMIKNTTIKPVHCIFAVNLQTMEFLKDFFLFLKERKKWWLTPVIIILVLLGVLLIVGGSSALAPFIYSLF